MEGYMSEEKQEQEQEPAEQQPDLSDRQVDKQFSRPGYEKKG